MKFTVFGSRGFIGSNLVGYCHSRSFRCDEINDADSIIASPNLGHFFYCAGLTSDFTTRSYDTVNAHVCILNNVIKNARFESLTYFSSTRVYQYAENTMESCGNIPVSSLDPGQLYNLSKLLGESICLNSNRLVRIVRLSNVVGCDAKSSGFLSEIIRSAFSNQVVHIKDSPDSEKDYVFIDDILPLLVNIATAGQEKIYNVASGKNVRNEDIAKKLTELTGSHFAFEKAGVTRKFPPIDIQRIIKEFSFTATSFDIWIAMLTDYFKTLNDHA